MSNQMFSNATQVYRNEVICGLFSLSRFVNDIDEVIVDSNVLLYADDLKIYRTVGNATDNAGMQNNLDTLIKWRKEESPTHKLLEMRENLLTFARKLSINLVFS